MGKFEASFISLEDDLYYFWIKLKILSFLKFSDFIKIKFIFFSMIYASSFYNMSFQFQVKIFLYVYIHMYVYVCVYIYVYI